MCIRDRPYWSWYGFESRVEWCACFVSWCADQCGYIAVSYTHLDVYKRQVAALCLTSFMQTTLLFLGLLTFPGNILLGLGIMLAANEVPRIAQQFGLDSSVRVNVMSVVHATTTAVNLTRGLARSVR